MIHREGRYILLRAFFLVSSLVFLAIYLLSGTWVYMISILGFFLYLFLVWFFRNPKRNFLIKEKEIVAPVDGRVVAIEEVFEPEFLNTTCKKISIFMSPLNVHVTRYPISGEVIYSKYHPGKYLVAWHPKSSLKNERTTVGVKTPDDQKIIFRQIAGFIARRIVLYSKIGDQAKAGHEFGFIKFGSRLDIFLPLDAEIFIQIGDKTRGGKTIIGFLS